MNMGNGGVVSLLKYIISILENDFKMGNEDDFKKLLEILNNLNNKTSGDINTLNQAVSNLINNLGTDLSIEIDNISTVLQSLINNGDWGLNVIAQLLKNPTYGLSKIIEAITTNKLLLNNSNCGLNALLNAITANKNLLNNSTYGLNALLNAINNSSNGYKNVKQIDEEIFYTIPVGNYQGETLRYLYHIGSKCKAIMRYSLESFGADLKNVYILVDGYSILKIQTADYYLFNGLYQIEANDEVGLLFETNALNNETTNPLNEVIWCTGLVYYN